ncbi:MAG TPA: hypothetical protein VIZ65_15325 [Cellvibrionaceae bacterium]
MCSIRLLILPLCVLSASCFAGSQMRLFAGVDSTAISTKEVDEDGKQLNKETGSLLGGGVGFEWLSASGVYYGGTIDVGDGDVDYIGESQLGVPIKNGTSYFYYWRPEVYAGKEIKEWWFEPRLEMEVGGQLKERHIDPRTEGIDGYKESYTWWYSGVGVSFEFFGSEDWAWRSGLNYRMMIQPTNETTIAKRDIELGSTSSISWINSVYLNLGEELYLGIELNITKIQMKRSRELYDGVRETEDTTVPAWISQPESNWQDINLRLAMSKRFDF